MIRGVKRLVRLLFTLAAIVSALLCLASAALWVRSYWRYDEVAWSRQSPFGPPGENTNISVVSESGQIAMNYQHYGWLTNITIDGTPVGPPLTRTQWTTMTAIRRRYSGMTTFGFAHGEIVRADLVSRNVLIPHWSLFAVTAPLPVVAVLLRRRRRRRELVAAGRCHACGYDLRATPDRCPECGAVPLTVSAGRP
jgi:hypothetical protein